MKIDIVDETKGLQDLLKELVRGGLKKLVDEAAFSAAAEMAKMVRAGYRTASTQRKPITLAIYEQGKSAGNIPARHRWSVLAGAVRSFALVNAVQVAKTPTGYTVRIDPAAMYSAGDPTDSSSYGKGKVRRPIKVSDVGMFLEMGSRKALTYTWRMHRYFMALKAGIAGQAASDGKARPEGPVPGHAPILVVVDARPVWALVRKKIEGLFVNKYAADLAKRFNRVANKYKSGPQIRF